MHRTITRFILLLSILWKKFEGISIVSATAATEDDIKNISTIEVAAKPLPESETLSALEIALRDIGIENARAFSTQFYTIAGKDVSDDELVRVGDLVHHYVTQEAHLNEPLPVADDDSWDFAIKIDYKPGVTDNAARVLKKDLGLIGVEGGEVYTSAVHYVRGEFNQDLKDLLERVASNPLLHDIKILKREEFKEKGGFERVIHPVHLPERPNVFPVDVGSMDEKELVKTGKKGTLNLDYVTEGMSEKDKDAIRGGPLSLALDYMLEIQKYSMGEKNEVPGRKEGVLTDTELEVLAQMWSEHCRHSLFNAAIPGSEKGIFDLYIKQPTLRVLEKRPKYKGRPDLGLSIYKDNSGVFKFNDRIAILIKNETHNSPSALDPYGGAITGIVGVNRDPMGTGKGGENISNFLFYYFGHPGDSRRYWKRKVAAEDGSEHFTLEELLLNPKQIYGGVNKGVQDGANQSGIALNQANVVYNDRYYGKPIVGVGTIGKMPLEINGENSWEKHIDVGDHLLIAGGRAGRDGIHGATFSSEGLHSGSPMGAVQVGDAYTQKKLADAILELRNRGYIKYITDLGAGGVSCAALEMAEETNGLEADLDKLLIKYPGMTATEVLMNESQERMAIAFDPRHLKEIQEIFDRHEVEFSVIGKFTDSGRAVIQYNGDEVVNLDMDFIHNGYPKRSLHPEEYRLSGEEQAELEIKLEEAINLRLMDYVSGDEDKIEEDIKSYMRSEFLEMLERPNLSSVAPFTDKMDSTVQGLAVQHCIQGRGRVTSRASCITPETGSKEGLIQSYGHTERQTYIDSEKMGKNAFLRSIGNNVAMGGRLDHMVATDQALWQSSDDGKYQQMLIEGFRGVSKVIEGCLIPVISGKDSMYNQALIYDKDGNAVKKGVFPTILMTTLAKIDDVNDLVTIDAKQEGDIVYVVGSRTKADMGGSEFVNMYGERAGIEFHVGQVSDESIDDVFDTFDRMNIANKDRLLQSAKYVEAGGLANAVKDTAMAGELGIKMDLDAVHTAEEMELHELMYGETEGRFVVTVKRENKERFEKLFAGKFSRIGEVAGDRLEMQYEGKELLSEPITDMLSAYHKTDHKSARSRIEVIENKVIVPEHPAVKMPRVIIPTGLGINSERELKYVFERFAGAQVDLILWNDLISNPHILDWYQGMGLAGGFAMGDHLGAGQSLANRIKHSRTGIYEQLREKLEDPRFPIYSVCNSLQIMAKLDLFPIQVGTTFNDSGKHETQCWDMEINHGNNSVWLKYLKHYKGPIFAPISHGEGRIIVPSGHLETAHEENLVALTYTQGRICSLEESSRGDRYNPNGSVDNIAGFAWANNLVLFPHFERLHHNVQRPDRALLATTEGIFEPTYLLFSAAGDYMREQMQRNEEVKREAA